MSRSGQIPIADRPATARLYGIMIPASGAASRLVSMKYFGNVPKKAYAIGPVVSWQDIDIAAEAHIHLSPLWATPPASSGQMLFSSGKMNAIPAIAAYESRKLTSRMSSGNSIVWIISALISTSPVVALRPVVAAISYIAMNMNALIIEGPAPVMIV